MQHFRKDVESPQIIIAPPIELSQLPESFQDAVMRAIRQSERPERNDQIEQSLIQPREVEPRIIEVPINFNFGKETEGMDFISLQQTFVETEKSENKTESAGVIENEVMSTSEKLLYEESFEQEENEEKCNSNEIRTNEAEEKTDNSEFPADSTSFSQKDQRDEVSKPYNTFDTPQVSPQMPNEQPNEPRNSLLTTPRVPIIRIKRHTRNNSKFISSVLIPPPSMDVPSEITTKKSGRVIRSKRKYWKKTSSRISAPAEIQSSLPQIKKVEESPAPPSDSAFSGQVTKSGRVIRSKRKYWKKNSSRRSAPAEMQSSLPKCEQREGESPPSDSAFSGQGKNISVNDDATISQNREDIPNVEEMVNVGSSRNAKRKRSEEYQNSPKQAKKRLSIQKPKVKPRTPARKQPNTILKRQIQSIIKKSMKEFSNKILQDISQVFNGSTINNNTT